MLRKSTILAFAALASLSLSSLAYADVPPPNLEGCQMKKAGDACVNDQDKDGTCVAQKCTKLDYSNGSPPSSVEYDCVLCSGPPGTDDTTESSDGCSVALSGAAASSLYGGAAIAAAALLLRRRRPRPRS